MGVLDAAWHLLNLFGPAAGVGVMASALAKWIWRRELKSVSWRSLAAWSSAGAATVTLAGLWLSGRDGRMSTYLGMVVAAAVGLWWRGFLRRG
jgi:hypothetical protein